MPIDKIAAGDPRFGKFAQQAGAVNDAFVTLADRLDPIFGRQVVINGAGHALLVMMQQAGVAREQAREALQYWASEVDAVYDLLATGVDLYTKKPAGRA